VKQGGSYFQGFSLTVSSGTGNYTQDIVLANDNCAINSVTVTPDKYGATDYITIQHLDINGNVISPRGTLADTIYNLGAGVSIMLDFSALELFAKGEKLRVIYTNVAGVAMNLYIIAERIR
jgi:hypothetical protein